MERLDLRLVEYFVAVAEELHFGRAAERLHIAQPSLSQQIRRLEGQIGVTLLERTSRAVRLTDAGEALLREGRQVLSHAQHALLTTRAAGTDRLVVGFYGSAGTEVLPLAITAFSARQPTVSVSVRELALGSIDAVLDGEVSVAFTRLHPGQTELEVDVITREQRLLAVATTHPLATRHSVTFAELADESFITNPAVPGHGARPPRWLAEQHRHGLPGRVIAQSTGVVELLTLVAAQRGVCLVPATVASHYPRQDVAYVPVDDAEPAVVSLARRPGPSTPAVTAFIETVRNLGTHPRPRAGVDASDH